MGTQYGRDFMVPRHPGRRPLESHPDPVKMEDGAVYPVELLEILFETPGKAPDPSRHEGKFYQVYLPGHGTGVTGSESEWWTAIPGPPGNGSVA